MRDKDRTKEQLINELVKVRQRIAELKASETERKQVEEEIQQKTEDLTLINSLNNAVNRGDSLQEIIQLLSSETTKIASGGGVTVYLVSEDKEYLAMQNLILPPATVNRIEKLIGIKIPMIKLPLKAESLYLETLQAGKPMLINDPATIQRLMAEFTETVYILSKPLRKTIQKLIPQIRQVLGIQSVIIVPLVSEGEAIGLLDISNREPLTESDLHRLEAISGQLTAIIKRKRAEEALRVSAQQWQTTFDALSDSVCLLDLEGTILQCNEAMAKFLGKPPDEIIGATCWELVHGTSEPIEGCPIVRMRKTRRRETLVLPVDDRWFSVSVDPVLDEDSSLIGAVHVIADITERKRAEEALQESEEKYRLLVENATQAIIVAQDGMLKFFNPKLIEIIGYSQEEIVSRPFAEFIHPDDLDMAVKYYLECLKGEETPQIYALRVIDKDGNIKWLESNAVLITWEDRPATLNFLTDITERKRAEQALKASQEYTRNIIDSSLDMIIAVDMDRYIVEFNKAAQETFGYRPEEVLGKHVDMLYADPREGLIVHQTTIEKGQCVREILDRHKNGQVFPAFLSASVLRDRRGELVGVMGVCRDITERKRAEEALRRRNRELALLHQAGQAFSSTLDLDQVLVAVLEEVRRLLDVVACSIWLTDPETGELVCQQAVGPQSEIVRGWRLAPGEGLAGWVARSGESLIVPDTRADERHFEDIDQQTGLGLRSILSVPLRVKEDVIGVLQVVDTEVDRFGPTDLTLLEPLAATATIAIENAQLYEQSRQDAETKTMLLHEVNHRVKNNLMAIIGLLYAEQHRAGMEDQSAYQSVMQDLINRVQGLSTVHSLLSASGWAPLLLSELASQVIRSSLQMLPPDKRVSVDVPPSPVRVTADQAHNLALVINELATNTVKHALRERDTAHIAVRIALKDDDDTVLFELRDDGPGYPEDVLQLERRNVGFDLMQNIVRDNLRGELSLHNDDGAVTIIQFKTEIAQHATRNT